ncbi:MAG: C-terminal binding protein [Thalassobaculaceae bacterium]
MARYTVLTPDAQHDDDHRVEREVAGGDVEFIHYTTADASDIPDETWERIDALLVWHVLPIDQRVLSRLKNCRIIVRCGVGFDHIDLAAAGAAGIPVSNCPDYGTNEVADHAIAMMLTFTRGLTAYHRTMTADPVGNYHWKHGEPRRIRHKTFGVVGFGRIGTAALLRAKAFGMHIVGYDKYAPRGQEIALEIERVESLEEVLERADVLSLHTPLTDETRGMIDAAALKRMKSDAILINTARGPIVDTAALLEALRNDEIAAAGLDVLPVEPASLDDPLVKAFAEQPDWLKDRLILTPHAAFNSEAGRYDARANSTRTMMRYLETGELWNCVNGPYLTR